MYFQNLPLTLSIFFFRCVCTRGTFYLSSFLFSFLLLCFLSIFKIKAFFLLCFYASITSLFPLRLPLPLHPSFPPTHLPTVLFSYFIFSKLVFRKHMSRTCQYRPPPEQRNHVVFDKMLETLVKSRAFCVSPFEQQAKSNESLEHF